ncbi:MAG: HAD-IIA family hydrolase [Acidilobaceae archaeon]
MLLIVDLDGVIWLGRKILWDNVDFLRSLERTQIVFVTNNSTASRREYAERLNSIGFDVTEDDVVTSAQAAALWLRERSERLKVYAIGERGLLEELSLAGLKIVDSYEEAEAVVVGLDRRLTYGKLSKALKAIMRGAFFVATNEDPTYPTSRGANPGAGAIVAALERASGRKPDFVAGKPNPWIAEIALRGRRVSLEDVVIIGDRVDTDIELAFRIGCRAVLVASMERRGELSQLRKRGVIIVESLKNLPPLETLQQTPR